MAAFRAQITGRAGDVTNLALPGSTGRGPVDLLSEPRGRIGALRVQLR